MRRARLFLALRLVGLLLIVAPFVFPAAPWWGLVCHRLPERALWIFGEPMPICSRCLGIFSGLGAGLAVAWPELPPRRLLLVVAFAALAMLIEIASQEAGWHPVFHPTRLLSGLLLAYPIGATAGALTRRASFSAEISNERPPS